MSWNVRGLLARCLNSLMATERPACRIVVVDNASVDGTVEMVRQRFPQVEVVANAENLGFTRGNNLGLRALGISPEGGPAGARAPDVVVLLNPDTEVEGEAIGVLASYVQDHAKVGAAGPELLWPDGRHQSSRRRFPHLLDALVESTPVEWHWGGNPVSRRLRMEDEPPPAAPQAVDWVTGACLALRREALARVGGLDEAYFMYSEELDLCRRLHEAGWEVHYVPAAKVVHHEGRSSEQAVKARHVNFHRSRLTYFRRHGPPGAALVLRTSLGIGYTVEIAIEAAKWLAGHNRDMRRRRIATYKDVLREVVLPGARPPAQDKEPSGWAPPTSPGGGR